ncbi:MAG: S-layer homology domain-containing protein [Erysipelotrichaceae bacterium]|nr:S-layer homology domain-containing protein [Erysipelotrichaceae bacterium]
MSRFLLVMLAALSMMVSLLPVRVHAEEAEPGPEIVTIADALAGAEGTEFSVKGVVTLVDGKNIYVQDETGAICLYLPAADSTVALGDTLIGTGSRTTYRGLPELGSAVIEKSEGLTLSAKETTISALTTADICTYVSLKDLEITELNDNNGQYTTPNITVKDAEGNTIQLYKAVVGKTDGVWDVAVGDKLNVKAAVGVYNTTLQLRNTLATEIEKIGGEEPEPTPAPEFDTIADALAGAEGTEFRVKGVVTLVDGKNIYVQDETGAICLYLPAADSTVALGDTLIGTGSRTTYRGLPELGSAVIEKSEGLTLNAKETTISALTTADICTYVSLKDLEVTEVYDNNGGYTTPNIKLKDAEGNTIQLYKAVVGKTDGVWDIAVGDKLNVKAAVGVNNTTLQLRNTLATEIEKISGEEPGPTPTPDPEDPYKDIDPTLNVYELTNAPADGDKVVIYNAGNGQAVKDVLKGNYYLEGEALTAEGDLIATDAEHVEWTVKANEDGTFTFVQNENTLAGKQVVGETRTNNNITLSAEDNASWQLTECNAENNSWYISNPAMPSRYESEGGKIYLEWYGNYSEFSLYDTSRNSEANFGFGFYKLVREKVDGVKAPTADVESGEVRKGTVVTFTSATEGAVIYYSLDGETWTEGNTYTVNEDVTIKVKAVLEDKESVVSEFTYTVKEDITDPTLLAKLAEAPADGAKVVIHHPASSMALTPTESGKRLAGEEAAVTGGKITLTETMAYMNVSVTEDQYVFECNGRYLTSAETGNGLSFEADGTSDLAKWKLEAQTDGTWVLMNVGANYNGNYNQALEYYSGFTTYGVRADNAAYKFDFYGVSESTGETNLVTDLSQLEEGTEVVIYSPGHKTAISSKPNGDWYLKAVDTSVKDNVVEKFTEDLVWTVKKNEDGTYSFYAYNDETRSITVWPSGTYAELSVNVGKYPDNTWKIDPAKTDNCWYISSPTVSSDRGPAYLEAFTRYTYYELFSGYFTKSSNSNFKDNEFALQFYLVNGEDAVAAYDDGEWDEVLEKDKQYVIYNVAAESTVGLHDEANFSMKAIPSVIEDGKTAGGNGTLVFTVDTMGRYYTFENNGKYLATNDAEEMLLEEPNEDGTPKETSKWYLTHGIDGGYIINNKEATYNGMPVCIEYYSSVFSGWTFSTKNDINIYLFNFYQLTDDAIVYDDVVQKPSILFDCNDFRYIRQSFPVELSLDDLAESIESVKIEYIAGERTGEVTDWRGNNRTITFQIPAEEIDGDEILDSFTIRVTVTNSYGITYSAEKVIQILDEPFFMNLTPAPNAQTGDDLRPVISALVCNAGDNPEVEMEINDEKVDAVFEDDVISYTPAEDMPLGRTNVKITAVREDGKSVSESWSFTVGNSDYQLYFGQLHSHTTYSDGSGTLDSALEYIASLPESANVDFVAFTDHSNYFDTTSAANPADAMNDKSLMTDASRALWEEYKGKVAKFNESQNDVIAIAGYEMTWSGGPGHINSYNTDGLVSRNNAELNAKTNDAGMKLYYATMNKDDGETMHQFNHPGATFGNFTDFAYWDEQTDDHMFLVEVGNGEGQIGAGGYYPSYEQYTLALDQGWHVAPTNNQDNHKGRWGNANDARDVVLTNDFSEQGIYDAIRARRVYATEDKNLQLTYTLNGQQMGTIIEDLDPNQLITINVTMYDPDDSDSIVKAEVIVNSGKVAYTWDDPAVLAEGSLDAALVPQYSYYYIRVTEADGDIAVTAPVWTGKAAQIGINEVTYAPEQPLVNEEITLTTEFYNNEYADATLKSIVYTVDGAKVLGTDTEAKTINGEETLSVPFTFTYDTAKRITVTVSAVVEYEGTELNLTKDVVLSVRKDDGPLPVTAIKDVQAVTEEGYEFAIEGTVTSNASGYDKDTAFFDCIYVQDETGGICCFPVSGNYKIGDKVHIEGYTDFYQGEAELQVVSIEVIGEGTVEPTEVTAKQVNDQSVRGSLVTLTGTIESVEKANDLIQTIMVKDEEGNVARVFIDGYITTSYEVENCEVGNTVSATGLASYDDTWPDTDYFARIRIRDRKDVVCGPAKVAVTGVSLDRTEAEMLVNEETVLAAAVQPEDAENKNVIWTSSDEEYVTVDESGKVTALKPGKAVITVTTEEGGYKAECEVRVLFTDAADHDRYFFNPVYWAVDEGITVGYGGVDLFTPDGNVTRGQMVTFLYRLAGEPEVTGDKTFNDVDPEKFYAKAISWAAENDITTGYADGSGNFGPNDNCTREQIVTFLWRYAKKPAPEKTAEFTDTKAGAYYLDALSWAAENEITLGLNDGTGRFGVGHTCTRAMSVTFLYRFNSFNKPNLKSILKN